MKSYPDTDCLECRKWTIVTLGSEILFLLNLKRKIFYCIQNTILSKVCYNINNIKKKKKHLIPTLFGIFHVVFHLKQEKHWENREDIIKVPTRNNFIF